MNKTSKSILTIGIDVSSQKLDIAGYDEDGNLTRLPECENTPGGWKKLAAELDKMAGRVDWVCMESTGAYSAPVATYLHGRGFAVAVVNPAMIKDYGRSQGMRNKTDAADAALIARFGRERARQKQLHAFVPNTKVRQELHEHVCLLKCLQGRLRADENRLSGMTGKGARAVQNAMIKDAERRIAKIERTMIDLCKSAPELARAAALLNTIPGVAYKTIMVALAEKIDQMDDVRALTAMHAMTPEQRQSGSSLNRARLSSRGRRRLRTALYFPTMSAMRRNPLVRAFAERLRKRGITGKKLVCACAHKLLRIMFGVLKNNQPFQADILLQKTTQRG